MSVGFGDTRFTILTTDGRVPVPSYDSDGFLIYETEVHVVDRVTYLDLQDLVSIITTKPHQSLLGSGTIIVEKGVGYRSLVYPDGFSEVTVNAILTKCEVKGRVDRQDTYRVACRWLLTGTVS